MKQVHIYTIGGGGLAWWMESLKRKGDDIGVTEGVDSNNGNLVDVLNLGQQLRRRPTGKILLQE